MGAALAATGCSAVTGRADRVEAFLQAQLVERGELRSAFLKYVERDRDRRRAKIVDSLQTWSPLRMQVFVNGHDWLGRKLDSAMIRYTHCDNVFAFLPPPTRLICHVIEHRLEETV